MKTLFNLTTDAYDLLRFRDSSDMGQALQGFDGLELMVCGPDDRDILRPAFVTGIHMSLFGSWLDFWNGDRAAVLKEFDTEENIRSCFGGTDPMALVRRFREDLDHAEEYGAEYVVFHVSDCSTEEVFTRKFRHSDQEVILGVCEILNFLFSDKQTGPMLLLENLWYPGLDFTRPEMTALLLDGIRYPNKGIMLDTGHLLHTDPTIRTQQEGLAYIHRRLDAHGDLVKWVKGVHLNQSITGAYLSRVAAEPPVLKETYPQRQWQLLDYVLRADTHKPYACSGVGDLIRRIDPKYLVYELITRDRAEHRQALWIQKQALR
jgi:hypothetical protein